MIYILPIQKIVNISYLTNNFYITFKYMTIDIHKVITGNPISKNLMKPWGSNAKANSLRGKLFNRYTGPGNPV